MQDTKKCPKCGETKSAGEYHRATFKGKTFLHAYCKPCFYQWRKGKKYRPNPERAKARQRRYRESHRDKIQDYNRTYAQQNSTRLADWLRRWRQENPDAHQVQTSRQRSRRAGCINTLSAQDWSWIRWSFDNRCLCCGRTPPDVVITIDHIIPLSVGGTNTRENVQPLCVACNSSKFTNSFDYRPCHD